jgi:hypothetical protein
VQNPKLTAIFPGRSQSFACPGRMKINRFLLLLLGGLVTGCATRYNVTLTNGRTITAKGKPRLDKASNCFVFKDATGHQIAMPAMRIREIAPASMSSENSSSPIQIKRRK